jgi:sugar phosphate isomerase/epimerase
MKFNFPKPFDWRAYWESHVDAIRQVSGIAASYGFRLAIENHANTMTPHVDSLLYLFEETGAANLGVNLDTVWAYVQREYLPWSIYRYGNRLFNVHLRDGDGLASYNLPLCDGNIDWEEVFKALKTVNYDGYVSFEWSHDSHAEEDCRRLLPYVRELIARC